MVSRGRLVAGAGDTPGRLSALTATAPPPDNSFKGRVLEGVQTASSGQRFLSAVSGGKLDISGLPGYLEKPLDILVSPISLALLAAAPFTGGASLTGMGVAGRLAGTAARGLAGGLVGGAVAGEVAKDLPEDAPSWVKVAAPLIAGAITGGITEVGVGARLPGALKTAARTAKPTEAPSGNYGLTDSPLDLPYALPGKTKLDQVMDTLKTLTRRGQVTNEQAAPIIRQMPKLSRTVDDEAQVVTQITKADESHPLIRYSKHTPEKGAGNDVFLIKKTPTPAVAAAIVDEGPTFAGGATVPRAMATLSPYAPATQYKQFLDEAVASGDEEAIKAAKLIYGRAADNEWDIKQAAKKGSPKPLSAKRVKAEGAEPLYSADNLGIDEKTWILPDGQEIKVYDHIETAHALGRRPESLMELGAVRRNGADAYAIDGNYNEAALALLDKAIARDAKRLIAQGNKTVFVDVGRNATRLSVYADRRALQLAEWKRTATGGPPAAPAAAALPPQGAAETMPAAPDWHDLVDVAAHPSQYVIPPDIMDIIKRNSMTASEFRDMLNTVAKKELVPLAKDIDPDGFYLPRGRPIEDGIDAFVSSRVTNLKSVPGMAKSRVYASRTEGRLNGEDYPPLSEAMGTYVKAAGNATVGRHALSQLSKLTDPEGNPIILDLNKAFPLRNELDEIIRDAAGKPVMQPYTAQLPNDYEAIRGIQGSAATRDVARAINNQLDPQGPLAQANKLAEAFNKPWRSLHVAFDLGDYIARIGPTAAVMHPVVFAKATGRGFAAVFNPKVVGQEFKSINEELIGAGMNMTVRDFAKFGVRFQNTDFAPGSLAKLPVISHLGGVYGNALDVMRARMFQAELMGKAKGDPSIIANTLALNQIAAGINLTTGASVGRPVPNASILTQFPNWLQSQIELILATGQKGTTGAYARQAMLRLVALGTTSAVLGNALSGHLTSAKDLQEMFWDGGPVVPSFRVGDQKINIFGPYASLAKGMFAAIAGDPSALIRGRAAPMIQMGWDLVTGETFVGQKAEFDDPQYWLKNARPYSVASIADRPSASGVLSAVGVNASTETPLQKLKATAEEELGKKYEDTTGKDRERLRVAHPDIYEQLQARTVSRAEAGDKLSKGILESQAVTEDLLKQEATMQELLTSGQVSPKQFRDMLNKAVQTAAVEKQRIRKDFGLDAGPLKPPSDIQKAVDGYYNLFDETDVGILNGGPAVGQVNWDEFERRLEAYNATLSPSQLKAIEDRVTPKAPQVQWYYDNREVINQAGYFKTADVAFEKFKTSIQRIAPGADALSDLYTAQNQAIIKGDKSAYAYTSALINQVTAYSEYLKQVMRIKQPELMKALVQNGYVSQPKNLAFAPNG